MNGRWISFALCWGLGCGLASAVVQIERDYRYDIQMKSRANVKQTEGNVYDLNKKGTTFTHMTSVTRTQDVTVSFDIKNKAKAPLDAELKWCFIRDSRKQGGGSGVLTAPVRSADLFDGQKLSLNPGESVSLTATGDFKYTVENAEIFYENTTKSEEKVKLKNYEHGDTYVGYVAVLVVDGDAVASASNLSSFLDQTWVAQCVSGSVATDDAAAALTRKQLKKLKNKVKFSSIALTFLDADSAPRGFFGKLGIRTIQPPLATSGLDGSYPDFKVRMLCELTDNKGNAGLVEFDGMQGETDEEYLGVDEWRVYVRLDSGADCDITSYILQYGIMNDGEFVSFVEEKKNVESVEELRSRSVPKFVGKFHVVHRYSSEDEDGEETQSVFAPVKDLNGGRIK